MDRRASLFAAGFAALFWAAQPVRLAAQPPPESAAAAQNEIPYGEHRLHLTDDQRQGTIYVPKLYKPGVAMPVVVMLHGFMGTSDSARSLYALAEQYGVIIIAPESRDITWGQAWPGFDADVHYIADAFREVSEFLDVDKSHVALAGVSDGAGYALSMGLAYGDTFTPLMIFSGGMMNPYRRQGKPRIFLAHGTRDGQMPIDLTAQRFVPQLKAEGYDVTYVEY